ncbi:hypothetical protein P280DRAFT_473657 [Massarina eburnea CBS 473.64]|uniref:TMEM205-like domain-containing protein n=1 Tax=Massarina eburnea CBS 473.64 TaxID=1395130 RepID=A0A6A6RKC4_9PLEO|nr:hypothetical protein P280DRAFT_473657 [Massarina eburnea CBS 473.64]
MTSLASFKNPAAYHVLSYGTLIGSTLFQSFISGIIAFRVLPRPQFSTLQKNIFPTYFILQTVTPALMILTYPSFTTRLSPSSASSAQDKLALTLIGTMLVSGIANMVYVGPETTRIMGRRKHQETRDGKKSYDKGPQSVEMKKLNKQFGVLHGVSSMINLIGFLGMCWYGVLLGERLSL